MYCLYGVQEPSDRDKVDQINKSGYTSQLNYTVYSDSCWIDALWFSEVLDPDRETISIETCDCWESDGSPMDVKG